METLLSKQTTADNKIITLSPYLPVTQPIGGRNVFEGRSLSGDSSRSRCPRTATEGRRFGGPQIPVYAVTPGGSYTSPRSSM